jgi:hypothetical protein
MHPSQKGRFSSVTTGNGFGRIDSAMLDSFSPSLIARHLTILDQILLLTNHTFADETNFAVTCDATDANVTYSAAEFKNHARFERQSAIFQA